MRVSRYVLKRLRDQEEEGVVVVFGDISRLNANIWEHIFKRRYLLFGDACRLACVSKHLRRVITCQVVYAPKMCKFYEAREQFEVGNVCQVCWNDNFALVPLAWNWHMTRNPVPVCHACVERGCWTKSVSNDTYRKLWHFYGCPSHWKWRLSNILSDFDVNPAVIEAFLKECVFPVELPANLLNKHQVVEALARRVTKLLVSKPLPSGDAKVFMHSLLNETPLVPSVVIGQK